MASPPPTATRTGHLPANCANLSSATRTWCPCCCRPLMACWRRSNGRADAGSDLGGLALLRWPSPARSGSVFPQPAEQQPGAEPGSAGGQLTVVRAASGGARDVEVGPRPGSGEFPQEERGREPTSTRSEEHTSELQSPDHLVCRLLLEK